MKKGLMAGILGVIAAILYFASMASYAYPGESAHLMAAWQGLDIIPELHHPLMAIFAKLFGAGNILAPICGTISVILVYRLVSFFVRGVAVGEKVATPAMLLSRIAGVVAALVFMLTPSVRGAATHLEPRMFDATWALMVASLLIPYLKARKLSRLFPLLLGVLMALGLCDSAVFVAIMPLIVFGIVSIEIKRGKKPYGAVTIFMTAFLLGFFIAVRMFGLDMTTLLKDIAREFEGYYKTDGWFFVAIFATLPFIISLFAAVRSFNEKPGIVQWAFHGLMTFVAILAIATPLSPSSLLAKEGMFPVLSSAYIAIFSGYLAAYWWNSRHQPVGVVIGVVFAFVLLFVSFWNLITFDGQRGTFADEVARKIVADLGDRKWFVTDGTLDDHLLLEAKRQHKELHLIALQRDLDTDYLEALGKIVTSEGVGGAKNEELALSLTLGVLPFVQDWASADPTIGQEMAIYGAADLWYSAGQKPVPEFFFFGADAARTPDWSEWKRFDEILSAPKGWGSFNSGRNLSPVDRLRLAIRRHLGLVANNRGVWLQEQKRNDEAFGFYELVLNEIDADNICALFNEIEMAGQKHTKAIAKKNELERRIKSIVDDKDRRYVIWRLASFYGYIRNPNMFVRLGFTWARSGRPGDALAQIRRAIDFVPTEKRTALLNMMAALYASENDQRNSLRIYESILAKDANDHDALIGMMRLKLIDGDSKSALSYLERAVKSSADNGRRTKIEQAMVSMMKNDLNGAKETLRKVIATDAKDLQAWSFLAAVAMQQYDAAKDDSVKTKLLKEIQDSILPEMERQATNPYDYYLQTTKAFLLMRKGAEMRRDARAAFELASRSRPDSSVAQDLVLGLDISLDDRASAERHAREVLRKNRNAPLANYVMGSLAIRRGQYREAEAFLRKAADAPQPNVLALNDLAEVLRRTDRLTEAEDYARHAIEKSPNFYILYETLGVILMDQKKDLDEAESSIRKALELSRSEKAGGEDVRLYSSLARVQILKGDMKGARSSIRRVEAKLGDLNEFEQREFEEIKKSVK